MAFIFGRPRRGDFVLSHNSPLLGRERMCDRRFRYQFGFYTSGGYRRTNGMTYGGYAGEATTIVRRPKP